MRLWVVARLIKIMIGNGRERTREEKE